MEKEKVMIADIVRTPWGRQDGSMEKFMSSDLAAAAVKKLLERTGIEPKAVDQVVFGQAHPSTMPNNIGHYAWLKAELPVEVPGYTVHANTCSALQALRNAYYLIASGNEKIIMAGGADSYSCAPFVMRDVRNHFYPQNRVIFDAIEEAECCTQPNHMSRMEQYERSYGEKLSDKARSFAEKSREKAKNFAAVCGDRIVPLSYTDRKKGIITVDEDEYLKLEQAKTPLAPYADGAAAAVLMSAEAAKTYHIVPVAELIGFISTAVEPERQQMAGAAAIKKLLRRNGLEVSDIAAFEIIENSAADVLETVEALGSPENVNPFGGALAFGKNDGAEGLAMLMRLIPALKSGRYGILCIYSAGGLGMAALVKKM